MDKYPIGWCSFYECFDGAGEFLDECYGDGGSSHLCDMFRGEGLSFVSLDGANAHREEVVEYLIRMPRTGREPNILDI